ncbi:MAG: hypothetical protein NTY68_03635 [Candidatus Micrarchaeota archaeon]|nr:hypothetical protein [Candidatus Micrarchaeota archaeon]
MQETEEQEIRARKEKKAEPAFEKKEVLDFTKEEDIGIAFRAEFKKEIKDKDIERIKESAEALDKFIEKSKSLNDKMLVNVAEMVDKKDEKGINKLFEKNQEMGKTVNAILVNKELCDFVVKNAYSENRMFDIKSVNDMVKAQVTVKKDKQFNDLITEMKKDDRFRSISENIDPVILYILAKKLVPQMMAGGVFGSMFKSLFMKMKSFFSSGILSAAKNMILVNKISMALMVFGTPDGFAASEILEGLENGKH